MNNRFRQIVKAQLMVTRHNVFAMLRGDETHLTEAVFIPRGEVDKWKEKYGDRLIIWEAKKHVVLTTRAASKHRYF